MTREILYMSGVVLAGFAVNYLLRALPFILFAGRDRALPAWVERVGAFISPVIIGALIIYSYSGLAWKTAWPYVAGALTVGLQLWKRNPLTSIVAGTVVYMCLLACGCTTQRIVELDARNPAIRYTNEGVFFGEDRVEPEEVPQILDEYDIPHDRVIHIRLDPKVTDLRGARTLLGLIAKGGYTRPVLVTERHSESRNLGRAKKRPAKKTSTEPARPKVIRYKGANE